MEPQDNSEIVPLYKKEFLELCLHFYDAEFERTEKTRQQVAFLTSIFIVMCGAAYYLSTTQIVGDHRATVWFYCFCFTITWGSLLTGTTFTFCAVLLKKQAGDISVMKNWESWLQREIENQNPPLKISERLAEKVSQELATSQKHCRETNEKRFNRLFYAQIFLAVSLIALLLFAVSKSILDYKINPPLQKEKIMTIPQKQTPDQKQQPIHDTVSSVSDETKEQDVQDVLTPVFDNNPAPPACCIWNERYKDKKDE